MKPTLLCAIVTALPLAGFAQPPHIDDARFNEIRGKVQHHQKITEEERDYAESKVERNNQEQSAKRNEGWAKEHPARESTGQIPLPDLGSGMYKGEQGGLYPGGKNTPPKAHLAAGLKIARTIVPLDPEGRPSADGRIVMCSIGMSNTTQESRSFLKLAAAEPNWNPKLTFVDCAQGAQTAQKIADPNFAYWKLVQERLKNADVTPQQVQVVWVKEADAAPHSEFLEHTKQLQDEMVDVMHNLHDKFPNLRIAYISSRIYGGWAGSPLNPEPWAYEEGFAMKWLIADQIAGNPELNYDPAKGAVRAPWMAWGPYLWADGLKGRRDGQVIWKREDLGPDGTHPSILGREKVARLLMAFLKSEPTAKPWFQ